MELNLAPIIVFAYNRMEHLQRTIEALRKNDGAKDSVCFIFSDGCKSEEGKQKINKVREYIHSIPEEYFREIHIIQASGNKGLATSVIEGVSDVISKYGQAIIVEDDVITAPKFLKFMNEALEFYKEDSSVWSIGGYTVPMSLPEDYNEEVLAVQRCSSYCWATWSDRWESIDWEITDYSKLRFNIIKRLKFNRFGNDRASMLDDQMNGRVNSWAIRFDYNMWKKKMVNILPVKSLANNIGHDGSGTHSTVKDERDAFYVDLMADLKMPCLSKVELNEDIRKEYVKFFPMSIGDRVKRYLGNLWLSVRK